MLTYADVCRTINRKTRAHLKRKRGIAKAKTKAKKKAEKQVLLRLNLRWTFGRAAAYRFSLKRRGLVKYFNL